jgi:hypothetical protein
MYQSIGKIPAVEHLCLFIVIADIVGVRFEVDTLYFVFLEQ